MAKIADLELVAEPDGTESVVILKDGEAKRATLESLVEDTLDTATAAADTAVAKAGEAAADRTQTGLDRTAIGEMKTAIDAVAPSLAAVIANLPAINAAPAAAADVAAALAVVTESEGVYILRAAGVAPGFYIANESIPVSLSVRRFYAHVTGGAGTVSVSVIKDGAQEIYGPVVVGAAKVEAIGAPLFVIPAKSDLSILVENVTGAVTRLMVKIEGIPA